MEALWIALVIFVICLVVAFVEAKPARKRDTQPYNASRHTVAGGGVGR